MAGNSSPYPGLTPSLPTSPYLSPQPSGVTGRIAQYGGEQFQFNGNCWMPMARDQVFRPPVHTNLAVYLDAEDIDADNTYSSAYATNGTSIGTWTNKGSAGNALSPNGSDARYLAFMENYCTNGRHGVMFDGNTSCLPITSSASSLGFITGTGIFDIYVVFRADIVLPAMTLFGNGTSSTDVSISLQVDASTTNRFSMTMTKNGSTILFWSAPSGLAYTVSKTSIVNIHGNGSSIFGSVDGGTESTQAYAVAADAGTMTRDLKIGAGHLTGTGEGNYWTGPIFKVLIYSSELTSTQRRAMITELKRFYSF